MRGGRLSLFRDGPREVRFSSSRDVRRGVRGSSLPDDGRDGRLSPSRDGPRDVRFSPSRDVLRGVR